MPRPHITFSGYNIIVVGVVVGALAMMVWTQACGLLLTHDSRQYLAAAQSFSTSWQFLGTDGTPITYWPPLFPILLSMLPESVDTLRWVHMILVVILSWQVHRVFIPTIDNKVLKIAYLILVLWGVHLLLITTFVWSEMIFMVLLLAFLQLLPNVNQSAAKRNLALAVGVLLCLQRHAGVFVVGGATVWLWWQEPGWKQTLKCLAFFFIATAGFWLWNWYISYGLSTNFQLHQHDFGSHVVHNLRFIVWSLFRQWGPLPESWVWPAFGLGVFAVAVFRKVVFAPALQLVAWITFCYVSGMALLFKLDVHDGDRYVAVIVPLVGGWVFAVLDRLHKVGTRLVRTLLLVAVAGSLLYGTFRTVRNAQLWHQMSCTSETAK